jgi:hypothetical protein
MTVFILVMWINKYFLIYVGKDLIRKTVLRILCKFFIEPLPDTQRKERQGTGKEKGRERGIWDCCMLLSGVHSASPHHLSPILPATSPACGYGYQDWRHSGEPPPPPYPFGQYEDATVVLLDGL